MSQPRYCGFWKATDSKWYLDFAVHPTPESESSDDDDFEDYNDSSDGEYEDCVTYGPFPTLEKAERYMHDHFANPGSSYDDDSGKLPPPTMSPNGSKVVSVGYGRVVVPEPVKAPAPVVTAPLKSPAKPAKTYKVYGQAKMAKRTAPVHTRVKGRVFGPDGKSRFKRGDTVAVRSVSSAGVVNPNSIGVAEPDAPANTSQYWDADKPATESLVRFIKEVLKLND